MTHKVCRFPGDKPLSAAETFLNLAKAATEIKILSEDKLLIQAMLGRPASIIELLYSRNPQSLILRPSANRMKSIYPQYTDLNVNHVDKIPSQKHLD